MIKDLVLKRIHSEGEWGQDDLSIERFHPSSAGFCKRQIFLSKINAKSFPEEVKGAMQVGSIIHDWIQGFREVKNCFDIEKEVKVNLPDSNIYFKGNADLVSKDNSLVIDLKSINGLSFVNAKPMDSHVVQLMVYMYGLGIDSGKIIYINKSNLVMVEHSVKQDDEVLNKTFKKIRDVYYALKQWDEQVIWGRLPFEKCGCYFCKNEVLDEHFEKLLKRDS